MLRVALVRASAVSRSQVIRSTMSLRAVHPLIQHFVRFESSEAGKPVDPKRAALEAKDDLQRDWDAKVLPYEELKPKTLQPSPNSYLIDVREPDEVLQGSIPSAVNLPLSVLADSLHLHGGSFQKKFGFPKPKKDQEVIFYCRSGVRSTSACDIAKRNGYQNILNYRGSWLEWCEREGKKAE